MERAPERGGVIEKKRDEGSACQLRNDGVKLKGRGEIWVTGSPDGEPRNLLLRRKRVTLSKSS